MPKFNIFLLCLIFSLSLSAQHKTEAENIKKVISTFFDGLHQGDTTLLKTTLHQNIKIQTIFINKKGVNTLETQTKANLLFVVARKKPSDIYFEKLLSYTIKIDGNLASVWTPYEFYVNGNFSHCGANSFQLFNDNGNWKIVYLVDMRRRKNCKAKKQKK